MQKVQKRHFHSPNRFFYGVYHLLSRMIILRKYHPTLTIVTDLTHFGLYVGPDYVEIFPNEAVVGKALLLTEEMHRLHAEIWKKFP